MKNRIHYSRYTDPDPVEDDYVARAEDPIHSSAYQLNELEFYDDGKLDFYDRFCSMVQRTDDEFILRHLSQIHNGTAERKGVLDALLVALFIENNGLYQMIYINNYEARQIMDTNRFFDANYVYDYMMDLANGVGPEVEEIDPLSLSKFYKYHEIRFDFEVDFLDMYVLSYFYGEPHEVSVARAVTW